MVRLVISGALAATPGCRDVHHDSRMPALVPPTIGSSVEGSAATAPPPSSIASAQASGASAEVTPSATSTSWPRAKPPSIETDWCIDAVTALDRETCIVVPDEPTTTLLVYFHGIVPPTPESRQKTNYQTVVAKAARRAHAVALLPRGRQELAPPGNPGWWAWPTTEAAYRAHTKELIDSVSRKREALEALLGVAFSRIYAAGSSSGAYFVAALALHGGMRADGFAAISGGAGRATPELPRLDPKPFYIGFGRYDSVGNSVRALAELLRQAGWPVRVAEHPLGHGASEVYLDEAFEFFDVTNRKER